MMILGGLLSKVFGASTAILAITCFIMFFTIKAKNNKIDELEKAKEEYKTLVVENKVRILNDSLFYVNMIRETQSVLVQVNNKNKSLERENTNLRKGVRLDLLTIRQRRSGKSIDSVYTIGYKYLEK